VSAIAERRKYQRASYPGSFQVQPVSPSKSGNVFEVMEKRLGADGRDISEGGLRFDLDKTLTPGSIVKISFKVREQDTIEHETYAKVMWVRSVTHGAQFLMLEDTTLHKIRGFIQENSKPV
jgi:hypothetical protein